MATRKIAAGAASAALALLASACADQLTTPAARLPVAPAFTTSASQPTLISNAVRYRDTGGRPARGRAGSAAVDAFALLGRDGVTEVELSARAADPANPATGTITRALTKVYAGNGTVGLVHSVNGGQPVRLPALPRGTRIDVQANVTGIDPHRTDVVSVSQTVRLRPDLEVTTAMVADSVATGTPVVVTGLIRELNGDVGANATCVLLLDGQPVDQARGIWVDAGDIVNCIFTLPALDAGTHELTLRLDGVAPADWDNANNSTTQTVVAYDRAAPYWAGGNALVESFTSRTFFHTREWNWGIGSEHREERTEAGTRQSVYVSGGLLRGFAAPLSIELRETSDGRVLQEDGLQIPNYGSPVVCGNRWNTEAGTTFYFCSYFGRRSEFQFYRASGTVAYHSVGYYHTWDGAPNGQGDYWHWNNTGTEVTGTPVEIGSDYGWTVRFLSADGDVVEIPLTIALEPWQNDYVDPDWCFNDGAEEWGWIYNSCQGSEYHSIGRGGSAFVSTLP
jgi:hypothetical protein